MEAVPVAGTSSEGEHRFGGAWTDRKLEVLAGYLASYTAALKNTIFEKVYIDAFAGTGYRDAPRQGEPEGQCARWTRAWRCRHR